ncbi:MAG TPA: glycosyltransferase family 2 protein, partial [Candidatus Paceibacterota bacterium]
MKLSVIIPAFKEPYLQRTIDSFLENSALSGEVEVIAVIDGPWMQGTIKEDSRVRVIQTPKTKGMRSSINAGLEAAHGDYVLKADAHCAFAPEFDRVMVENCEDNWLVIPRMYALDDALWKPTKTRWPRDHHYLQFPFPQGRMAPYHYRWGTDDTMSFQGSCWLAHRHSFMKRVGFLDDNPQTYGSFAGDQLEIGLKYWLGGGEVKVNSKTWYAHL